MKDESVPTPSGSSGAQKLVTADGTYATQSAFSADVKPGAGKSASANVDIGSIGNHEVRCWVLISVLSAIKWSFA